MRTYSIRYRPAARRDIEAISDYIFEKSGSAETALRYVRRLHEGCRKICDAPFAHVARNDLGDGIRMAVFERKTVILYRVEADAVLVISIFSRGRDYERLLRHSKVRHK